MIDPGTLAKQKLAVVRPGEVRCSRCGTRTRDASGTCRSCRRDTPNLTLLTVEQLAGLVDAARAELQRRRDEIEAALKVTA